MPQKREIPPRIRRTNEHVRDSSLIIIATEGKNTEKKYFDDLKVEFHNSKINVLVIPNIDNKSDPESVHKSMDKFREEYATEENDILWLVIDRDRWKEKTLSEIAQLCKQQNIYFGVSNPCFEIWLLFHVKNISEYMVEEKEELRQNLKDGTNATRLERELRKILGEYNKSNPNTNHFFPYIHVAINQAKKLDTHHEHRWPQDLGSRVYILMEQIFKH